MNRTDLVYRKMAVEGASGFGLLIALYDTLAGDLRRAAAAQRANEIEKRCNEAKHAMMVIGYLESCLDRSDGGELTLQLRAFYGALRRKLIQAQVRQSAEIFEQEMATVLRIREYWQKIDQRSAASRPDAKPANPTPPRSFAPVPPERRAGGWSV